MARKIVKALALNLSVEEENEIARVQTKNLEAWEEFQKGWDEYHRFTFEGNAKAIEHLKKAVELDPKYGRAYAALGMGLLQGQRLGMDGSHRATTEYGTKRAYCSRA